MNKDTDTMDLLGVTTGKFYCSGRELARAGEGAIYTVQGQPSRLIKIFTASPNDNTIKKLQILSEWPKPPLFTALPQESVCNPTTKSVIGFVQPFFAKAVPLTSVLDSHGRRKLGLPDDMAFRVKLCRLLAEALTRLHAANLIMGDVSDSNFLLGRNWLGVATVVYVIDCNSLQLSIRTNRGNETFPSGVASEPYTAPEIQPTDWSTSLRSVFSDSFGFAVLAWKIVFNGAHPFATVTPRHVDVPPLGQRIERRLFPFAPATPLPTGWQPPTLVPSLTVLPHEVREMFCRAFATDDPRDRPTAEEWSQAFQEWQASLRLSLTLRLFGPWHGAISDCWTSTMAKLNRWFGRGLVFVGIVLLTVFFPHLESVPSAPLPTEAENAMQRTTQQQSINKAPHKPMRPRSVDRELFPESLFNPASTAKE